MSEDILVTALIRKCSFYAQLLFHFKCGLGHGKRNSLFVIFNSEAQGNGKKEAIFHRFKRTFPQFLLVNPQYSQNFSRPLILISALLTSLSALKARQAGYLGNELTLFHRNRASGIECSSGPGRSKAD